MASLSNQQADAYLDRIRLPSVYRRRLLEGPDGPRALATVAALQQHHMAAVPFENLQLHYTPQHTFSIEAAAVFAEVVGKRRGGTCVQVHPLFAALLRRFGFMVTLTGARVNAGASIGAAASVDKNKVQYGGLTHLATLVMIHGQRHLVDTAMGSAASPTPVPLIHDQPETDIGHRQRRLLYTTLPDTIDSSATDKWWRLQNTRAGFAFVFAFVF